MSGTEIERRIVAPLEPVEPEIIEVKPEPVAVPAASERATASMAQLVSRGLSLLQGLFRLGLLVLEERSAARETPATRMAASRNAPSSAPAGTAARGGGRRRRHRGGQ